MVDVAGYTTERPLYSALGNFMLGDVKPAIAISGSGIVVRALPLAKLERPGRDLTVSVTPLLSVHSTHRRNSSGSRARPK